MDQLFKRIPFPAKLVLIGLIPLIFLVYLALQLYHEKAENLRLIQTYIQHINESADITYLIDNLQEERKYSFDYAMTNGSLSDLSKQRPVTDSLIAALDKLQDPALKGFKRYTGLYQLSDVRNKVDSNRISPATVMHFYSNIIFRLNTLNIIPVSNTGPLQPLYQNLAAQKILSEMITYLGIIRSNVYNVLYTKQYMVETLMGTVGTHDVFKSYESEFLIKAAPSVAASYQDLKASTEFGLTVGYIDTLFARFRFDSTYDAAGWWRISNKGANELRSLQQTIWRQVKKDVFKIQEREQAEQSTTMILLLVALIFVLLLMAYTIHSITRTLSNLKVAAQKMAEGKTGLQVPRYGNDVIAELAACIAKIDDRNQQLADAAYAIGKGNFKVDVQPGSEQDLLSNAILKMRTELQQYREEMEELVRQRTEELNRSNEDLQQFAHVASHDLREPLRKIRIFSSRLLEEPENTLSETGKLYLNKIEQASERMSNMVEGVLSYSILNADNKPFEQIDLNQIVADVKSDLELAIQLKNAIVQYDNLPEINGIPVLIHQLIYNLVNNSLKFVKEGVRPEISITHRVPGKELEEKFRRSLNRYVEIIVKDNGIGFNQELADQMFQVFTRLNPRDAYEGTGLGLALCKRIAQRHHGFIFAQGSPGAGASFHIVLPK
jgi:signal transduction histidine kinase